MKQKSVASIALGSYIIALSLPVHATCPNDTPSMIEVLITMMSKPSVNAVISEDHQCHDQERSRNYGVLDLEYLSQDVTDQLFRKHLSLPKQWKSKYYLTNTSDFNQREFKSSSSPRENRASSEVDTLDAPGFDSLSGQTKN